MPPVTKLEQTKQRDDQRRSFLIYGWLAALIVTWGSLGCMWVNSTTSCAATSPAIYRLALLLSFIYLILLAVITLGIISLAVDFCLSGKLRFVVVLEQ